MDSPYMTSAFMGQFQTGLQNASQNFSRSYEGAADRRSREFAQQQQLAAEKARQEANNQFAMQMEQTREAHATQLAAQQEKAAAERQAAQQKFLGDQEMGRRKREVDMARAKAGDFGPDMDPELHGIAQRAYTTDPSNYNALKSGQGLPDWLPQGQTTERQDRNYVPPSADAQGRGLGQPGSFPMQDLLQVPKAGGSVPLQRAPGVHAIGPGDPEFHKNGPAYQFAPNGQRAYVPLQDTMQQHLPGNGLFSPGVAPLGSVPAQTTRSYTPAPEIQNAIAAQDRRRFLEDTPLDIKGDRARAAEESNNRRLDQEAMRIASDPNRSAMPDDPGYQAAIGWLTQRGLYTKPVTPQAQAVSGIPKKQ